jgi:hypothetical protein
VLKFIIFRFRLFTPPLGDFQRALPLHFGIKGSLSTFTWFSLLLFLYFSIFGEATGKAMWISLFWFLMPKGDKLEAKANGLTTIWVSKTVLNFKLVFWSKTLLIAKRSSLIVKNFLKLNFLSKRVALGQKCFDLQSPNCVWLKKRTC